jgi:hypothetical protein
VATKWRASRVQTRQLPAAQEHGPGDARLRSNTGPRGRGRPVGLAWLFGGRPPPARGSHRAMASAWSRAGLGPTPG